MPTVLQGLPGADVTVLVYLAAFFAVTCAGLVQSSAGIGFGLIAAPILLLIDPSYVPGTVIFLGTTVSLLSSIRDKREVIRPYVLAGIVGRIPAAILAASVIVLVSETVFQLIFAALVLLAVALSLFGPTIRPSVPVMAAAGVASGFMGTLTSVGAPPFALALQHAPSDQMRATLNAVLLLGACVSMVSLAMFGNFGWADMLRGVMLLPAAYLGFLLAPQVIRAPWIAQRLRPIVLGICVLASLVLLARAAMTILP